MADQKSERKAVIDVLLNKTTFDRIECEALANAILRALRERKD